MSAYYVPLSFRWRLCAVQPGRIYSFPDYLGVYIYVHSRLSRCSTLNFEITAGMCLESILNYIEAC